MSTFPNLIYEKSFNTTMCYTDTIELIEYNNYVNDVNYVYSGLTLILPLNDFNNHYDISGHTYNDFRLNNDAYSYTGLTGETHYFYALDFYSGSTTFIDPKLTGFTESEIISGFTKTIIPSLVTLIYSGNCTPIQLIKDNNPWVYQTNQGVGVDYCEQYIPRRPELGFTLDFVFNKNGLPWSDGVFFYNGVRDEYEIENYADNNLSFSFTDDGRIKWSSYRFSGHCDNVSGYTETYYLDSGITPILCPNGTSSDFNITISFERYYEYKDCDLDNKGGYNDLIIDGVEVLNKKWSDERNRRLGTLKIYLNGNPIYKIKDWEEVIPSDRGFQPFINSIGGGVSGCNNIHNTICCYQIKYLGYFYSPMGFPTINERYKTITKENFDIVECSEICVDSINRL